ncbi:MAG: serine hydrolase domain-containing protein [Dermatophilaceae bacterium]
MNVLPTDVPSAQGVDARGILALVDALDDGGHDPHSLLLARHGRVLARGWWAPYAAERVHLVYSLSKSFTATAVGLLVDEGRLSLEDRVLDLLAGDLPPGAEISERYRRLTVGHCLTMATGHDAEAWTAPVVRASRTTSDDATTDPVLAAVLTAEPEHEPGTAWAYNQVATYLAASVVRAVTGTGVLDLLRRRVLPALDPDGADRARWHRTATGRELGFSGLHLGTDALLSLAQTYLDRGRLAGEQLLSAGWVAAATAPTGLPNREPGANPDWRQGYGCSFWKARHGYRGDGAYGQLMIVLPEQDAVLALTSETAEMQAVLDLVWQHLLPAFDHSGDTAATDDTRTATAADAALAERMRTLAVPALRSSATGPDVAVWTRSSRGIRPSHGTRQPSDTRLPDAYTGVRMTRAPAAGDGSPSYRLTVERRGTDLTVDVGDGRWLDTRAPFDGGHLVVAASGGWHADGAFEADLRVVETPHRVLVRARGDGTVELQWAHVPLHGPDPRSLLEPGRPLSPPG